MSRIFTVLADEGYKCNEDGLIGLMADKAFRLVFPYQGKIWIPAIFQERNIDPDPDWEEIWARELASYDQEPTCPEDDGPDIFFDVVGPGEIVDYDGYLVVPVARIKQLHTQGEKLSNITILADVEKMEAPGVMVRRCGLSAIGLHEGIEVHEYCNSTEHINFGVWKNDLKKFLAKMSIQEDVQTEFTDKTYITPALKGLILAEDKFWGTEEKRRDRSKQEVIEEVAKWLVKHHGYKITLAKHAARIIKPTSVKPGRKPEQ